MRLYVSSSVFVGLVGPVRATPSEYMETWSKSIHDAIHNNKYLRAIEGSDDGHCGSKNDVTAAGNMWFTAAHCRLASKQLTYLQPLLPLPGGQLAVADVGEIIRVQKSFGDNVYFPPPAVPDCYFAGNASCAADEFCMVERHEKWGGWAEAPSGLGSNKFCTKPYFGWDTSHLNELQMNQLNASVVEDYCDGVYCKDGKCDSFPGWINQVSFGIGYPQAWRPARGQCVKYRKERQSCYVTEPTNRFYSNAFIGTADPHFNAGGGINRPFVCDPKLECKDIGKGVNTCVDLTVPPNIPGLRNEWETCAKDIPCGDGLVCTGRHLEILNNTCVTPRPADLCFAGPWWDSTKCPRTGKGADGVAPPCGGMTPAYALESLMTTMLLSPGEIISAGQCDYWYKGPGDPGWYQRMADLRKNIHSIFDTLWPKHLPGFEFLQSFEEIEILFGLPSKTYSDCVHAAAKTEADCKTDPQSAVCVLHMHLVNAASLAIQPNKVWSIIHWVMTNLQEDRDMSPAQVDASHAIALIMRDNFWCNDCRGFFDTGVLGVLGYPPTSTRSLDHEYYWNLGHNQASEHVASTRGSHPWIMQLAGQSSTRLDYGMYQNPFFVPYLQAHMQWKQVERDGDGECLLGLCMDDPRYKLKCKRAKKKRCIYDFWKKRCPKTCSICHVLNK